MRWESPLFWSRSRQPPECHRGPRNDSGGQVDSGGCIGSHNMPIFQHTPQFLTDFTVLLNQNVATQRLLPSLLAGNHPKTPVSPFRWESPLFWPRARQPPECHRWPRNDSGGWPWRTPGVGPDSFRGSPRSHSGGRPEQSRGSVRTHPGGRPEVIPGVDPKSFRGSP